MVRYHWPSAVRLPLFDIVVLSVLLLKPDGGGVMAQDTPSPTGAPTATDDSDYPDCAGYVAHIKDGYCDIDLNNAECGFDGGDCCVCTCGADDDDEELPHPCGGGEVGYDCQDPDVPEDCGETPSPAAAAGYPGCEGPIYYIQDSYCDDELNNAACGFDGGDCCRCTCREYSDGYSSSYYWWYTYYDYDICGINGYDCLDPEAPSSCITESPTPSPAAGTDYPECEGSIIYIGDGYCDYENNNDDCAWDGGDCCACTCKNDFGSCGVIGYDCLDPSVSSDCTTTTSGASYTDDVSSAHCISYYIGDGMCDYDNNVAECAWDGGDCCPCDCENSIYLCGDAGYNCLDPSSDCRSGSTSFDDDVSITVGDDDSHSPGYPGADDDDNSIGESAGVGNPTPSPLTTEASSRGVSAEMGAMISFVAASGFFFFGLAIWASQRRCRRGGRQGSSTAGGGDSAAHQPRSSEGAQEGSALPMPAKGAPVVAVTGTAQGAAGGDYHAVTADDVEHGAGLDTKTAHVSGGVDEEDSDGGEEKESVGHAVDSVEQADGSSSGGGGDTSDSNETENGELSQDGRDDPQPVDGKLDADGA